MKTTHDNAELKQMREEELNGIERNFLLTYACYMLAALIPIYLFG